MTTLASNPVEENGRALAQAIVDTVREPLLVLDDGLRVVTASRSFYLKFQTDQAATQGRLIYELGDGQWDIPALRLLLRRIVPDHAVMEDYEVALTFPKLGRRTMLLNARKVFYEASGQTTLLLAIEDVTERRRGDQALAALLEQKEVLLREMQHRVANSLQIIASIMMMKARSVTSEETRLQLEDAHQRVMSVAAVQQHLQASRTGESIPVSLYLSQLCESLEASMIGEERPIRLRVTAAESSVSSTQAVSIGLIVTELVINALKHAFPYPGKTGRIDVAYEVDGTDWRLSVADDGVGKPDFGPEDSKGRLGTSIVKALAQQLDGTCRSRKRCRRHDRRDRSRHLYGSAETLRLIAANGGALGAVVPLRLGRRRRDRNVARFDLHLLVFAGTRVGTGLVPQAWQLPVRVVAVGTDIVHTVVMHRRPALRALLPVLRRLALLLRLGHRVENAKVVLGMLEIAFGHHPVAHAGRIAAKLQIALEQLLRGAAYPQIRAAAVEHVVAV